jgi:hypothetical protein
MQALRLTCVRAQVVQGFRSIPGFNKLLTWILSREAATSAAQLQKSDGKKQLAAIVPSKGMDKEEVLSLLREGKERDSHDEKGRLFGYVYTQNDEAFEVRLRVRVWRVACEVGGWVGRWVGQGAN